MSNNNVVGYNGNPNLRPQGYKHPYTKQEILEVAKCKKDPIYFIEKYVKIVHPDRGLELMKLYPYQKDMILAYWKDTKIISLTGRQMGKSTTFAAFLCWYIIFVPSKYTIVLANKLGTAREIFSRFQLSYENLPIFLQQGVKEWNKLSVELENGSKARCAATSASAVRGHSPQCVTGDTFITICDEYNNIFYNKIQHFINNSKFVEVKKGNEMKYIVYKITNLINDKIYVGFHKTTNIDDGYMGSGKLIKRAIEKYGVENFRKDIIGVFDNQKEAEALEAEIVNKDFSLREDTYNICVGGNVRIMYGENNPFYGKKHTKETRDIISKANAGKTLSEEHKKKISASGGYIEKNYISYRNTTYKSIRNLLENTSEFKTAEAVIKAAGDPDKPYIFFECFDKQRIAEESFKISLEESKKSKEKLRREVSQRFKGVQLSDEHKKKISNTLKGRKKTKEHSNKINKNLEKIRKTAEKHRGMKRSEESKKRMSEKRKEFIEKNGSSSFSGKGCFYIHNKETKKSKRWYNSENIPIGWLRGNGRTKRKE